MPVQSYASPTDDQMAWRDAHPEPGMLPPHLIAFLQSGVDPIIGVRRPDGRPLIGAGVACRVDERSTVRVFIPCRPNREIVDAIHGGSAAAATFSRVRDHRSIQLKARSAEIEDVLADDHCEIARQSAIAIDALVELGYTRSQIETYHAFDLKDLKAVTFRPEQVFTQTPGPGAGAELKR